ncbi:MAG: hypothetical protein KKC76_01540 [Proteobacteria bacterium]|nr:hypothetical protein [Pseudomonadota bacterium]MBU4294356.1 hypothetical protein [Pseudomonadota bacterium]MCG2749143.1 hypothetical protein [Desulfobulbaceae bacterium]
MTNSAQLKQITKEIRQIYQADRVNAAALVEEHLIHALADYSASERLAFLERCLAGFGHIPAVPSPPPASPAEVSSEAFNKLLTMLLGKEILERELSTEEMIKHLAAALNTVFDSVNKLIGGINATLMGSASGEETIRVVISSSIDEKKGIASLEKYLDQIGQFFAIALRAYKEAAQTKIGEILNELDPVRIAEENENGLKFGPLRKAHQFDCYQDKYKTLLNWQRSGLLLEAFMKEFEKNCQKLYLKRE